MQAFLEAITAGKAISMQSLNDCQPTEGFGVLEVCSDLPAFLEL